ncbi:hypothetical protein [uncultured Nostoc sp.]|uniref:hypothetical protein n=1 Tax=uncultured Nostoc sp. TaxID=340711 RepID=UPI0035CC2309
MSESPTQSKNRQAILLIPGFGSRDKKEFLYNFSKGIEGLGAKPLKHFDKGNCSIKEFEISDKLIDIYEAYWGDIIEDLTKMELTDKVPRGAYLIYYWLFSGIYKTLQESRILFLFCTVFLLVFICWYFFSILIIFSQLVK